MPATARRWAGRRRPHGLGDPRFAWNVLLRARLEVAPDPAEVADRVQDVRAEVGWPIALVPSAGAHTLAGFAGAEADGASVALDGRDLLLRAAHQDLDGLGLLVVLGRLTGAEVRSAARGVGDRPRDGSATASALRRLAEVLLRSQARVAPSGHAGAGDVFAARAIPGEVDTATLVVATVDVLRGWNAARARRTRRISVAVGVSTVPAAEAGLRDQSAFLRLRDAERLDADRVRAALRHAPVQHGAAPAGPLAPAVRLATRVLAGRLGSTVLVSHLGRVDAPGVVGLELYPVSGGGSGLAVGAATVGGRTTLTLRARGRRHSTEGLEGILEALLDRLRGRAES